MKNYRVALNKWNMGTGGGPDHPPEYFNVDERDDKYFQDYDKTRGSMLCWIFMHDKKLGFILDAKNQSLPPEYSVETAGKEKTTRTKRPKAPSLDEQLKHICTAISDSTNSLLKCKNKFNKYTDSRFNSNDGQLSEAGSEITFTNDQREDILLAKAQQIENLIDSINKNKRITKKEKEIRTKTLDTMLSRAYTEMSLLSQKQQIISDMSIDVLTKKSSNDTSINFQSTELLEDIHIDKNNKN